MINREARRMDKEIKEVLDELSDDEDRKVQLLTGKRVVLAEELSKCSEGIVEDPVEIYRCFLSSSCSSNPREIGGIHKRTEPREMMDRAGS